MTCGDATNAAHRARLEASRVRSGRTAPGLDEGGTVEVPVRTRVSAYGIVLDGHSLLLTRLSAASPIFAPGLWHLPGGGVDPGEQPAEALSREIREETGLEVSASRLVDARTYAVRQPGVEWNLTALFYAVDVQVMAPTVTEVGGSTDAAVWKPVADLDVATLSPVAVDALGMLDAARGRGHR